MNIKIHKHAIVEIQSLTGVIRTCHLKEIKEVIIGTKDIPSSIDGLVVAKEDAELIRDIMINKISFKDAVNC